MQKKNRDVFLYRKRLSSLPLVVTLCGVITLSLLTFWVTLQLEQTNRRKEFERKASKAELSIQQALDHKIQSLESIVALYNASEQVERQEFKQFVQFHLLDNSEIQALEWVPRIPSTQRETFEKAARQNGFPGFQITERNQQGQIVTAGQRPEYFPVYYVEPFQGNETALGFDLSSDPTRLKALNQARDQGKASATVPIDLIQDTEKDKKGILVFLPIFRQNQLSNSILERRQNLEGFALSVFQVESLMNGVLDVTLPRGFDFYLFDQSLPQSEQLLYTASSIPEKTFGDLNGVEINALQQGIHYATTLEIAERRWLLIVKPNADSIGLQSAIYPWMALATGGVLVVGLIVYSKSQQRVQVQLQQAKDRLAQQVQERTTDLLNSNQQLTQQIAKHKQSEIHIREITQRLALATDSAKIGVWDFDVVEDRLIWDDHMYELYGIKAEEFGGAYEAWKKSVHPEDLTAADADIQAAITGEREYHPEFRVIWPDGQVRFIQAHAIVLRSSTGKAQRMIGVNWDITDRKQIEQTLAQKVQQQATIAELGRLALTFQNLDQLMDEVVVAISTTLDVEYCKILKLLPDGESLLLKAGVGWQPGLVGQAVIGIDDGSQADFILRSTTPIIVEDLQTESRFCGSALLRDHQVISGMSVIIEGRPTPYGIIGAYSVEPRLFTANDVDFLQSISNLLAQALERRQIEFSVKQSEARFRTLVTSAPVGIFQTSPQGECQFVNTLWQTMTGLTADEAMGTGWSQALHPDDRERIWTEWRLATESGAEFESEYRFLTPQEDVVWVYGRANTLRDDSGTVMGFLGTVTDISERKQAEAERIQSEKVRLELSLLEQILDDVLAGYWDWDIPRHQEYLSSGFKLMMGYQDHELPNTPESIQSLIFQEDLPSMLRCFDDHVQSQGETPFYHEGRYHHKDGTTLWIICSGRVIEWDKAGQPLRMIGCYMDMSDRIEAEEQIHQYSAQLEASNRELEAFAYSVSHDLRAPLRAIDGFSRALLEDYADLFDVEAADYFDRIRNNVMHMSQLIDGLLDLSRVSRSKVNYASVNLSTLAQEVLEQLQAAEPERQVNVQISPNEMVSADATLMRVILTNLLQNAWKFTHHHSTAHIEFGVSDHKGELAYFVRDDGAGFDMSYAQKLFGVFQRLHNTQEFPGTGIGLASVQRAVHHHGGAVWAEAALEKGATFYFTIPSSQSHKRNKDHGPTSSHLVSRG